MYYSPRVVSCALTARSALSEKIRYSKMRLSTCVCLCVSYTNRDPLTRTRCHGNSSSVSLTCAVLSEWVFDGGKTCKQTHASHVTHTSVSCIPLCFVQIWDFTEDADVDRTDYLHSDCLFKCFKLFLKNSFTNVLWKKKVNTTRSFCYLCLLRWLPLSIHWKKFFFKVILNYYTLSVFVSSYI